MISQSVYSISGGYMNDITSMGSAVELMAQLVVLWFELRVTQLLFTFEDIFDNRFKN